jgi:hypothetical protein
MRRRAVAISVVLSMLVLALAVPSAALGRQGGTGPERTDFVGFVFPAGYPYTGTVCQYPGTTTPALYVESPLPTCILDRGTATMLAGGRTLIRDELVLDGSYAWHDLADLASQPTAPNEPRRSGYNVESFNAIFDATLSGPAWGTWKFYDLMGRLIFVGAFAGSFDHGQPTMYSAGLGTGDYRGQSVWMSIFPAAPGAVNMSGYFLSRNS